MSNDLPPTDENDDGVMPRQERLGFLLLAFVIATLVLVAVQVDPHTTAGIILLSMAASLSAVLVIGMIWRTVGGEPLRTEVHHLRRETDRLSDVFTRRITRATHALQDIERTGIERIHTRRSANKLVDRWLNVGASAKNIDLLGLTLYKEWLGHPELCQLLERVAAQPQSEVRIMLLPLPSLHDGGTVDMDVNYRIRAKQPGEEGGHILDGYLQSAHTALDGITAKVGNESFKVQYLKKCIPYSMLVRIDTYIFVAPYVASNLGERSFAIEAHGARSPKRSLYRLYCEEFEAIWDAEADTPGKLAGPH